MPTITHTGHTVGAQAPTDKQVEFLLRLAGDRIFPRLGSCGEERMENMQAILEDGRTTRATASRMIDDLMRAPIDRVEREAERKLLTPGVYEVNGEIFNVKWNKAKTNLYAQRLVENARINRFVESGDTVHIEFEYAPGVVARLRPHHKMSIARAEELTIRYGRCLVCGRKLKDAESVKQGIGPVCRKTFA